MTEGVVSEYNRWHERVHGPEDVADLQLASWHRSALALAPDLAGRDTLEVGCGAGDFSIHLSKAGANVTAIDFSPRAIDIAIRKARHHRRDVTWRVADAEALPFEDGRFDVVFSCECLEHVPHPPQMIAELSRVLKSGGVLVLTTENYSNAMLLAWLVCWLRHEPFDSGAGVQPIEHFFVYWRIEKWMRRAGFVLDRLTGTHHVFLMLPRVHPHTFVKEEFQSSFAARLWRPLARHMSFRATKR
jgi:ubiquinone biosynthesis O-methyltransferase